MIYIAFHTAFFHTAFELIGIQITFSSLQVVDGLQHPVVEAEVN